MSVLRCKVCGQTWACEYPFSEHHGGGAPCFYQITADEPEAWLAQAVPIMDSLWREGGVT
jgi:hypothetical protein